MGDLPYAAEYAKSGRAACKSCKDTIAKDSLRMSVRTQSAFFDGKQDNWFHFKCFWAKTKGTISEQDIRGMDNLKWEDRERVCAKINDSGQAVEEDSSASYRVEKAKSAKGKCKKCQSNIPKGDVKFGVKTVWYCLPCAKSTVAFKGKLDDVSGFDVLDDDSLTLLRDAFPPPPKAQKRKGDSTQNGGASATKKSKSEEAEIKMLKAQTKDFWEVRDGLKANVHKSDWKGLLESNNQELPAGGDDKLLDRLADCMLFGALEKCPECKKGQLVYSTSHHAYMCVGYTSAWAKCEHQEKHPKRQDFVVDEGFLENEYLASFKFVPGRKRVYASSNGETSTSSQADPASSSQTAAHPYARRSEKLLSKSKKSGGISGKSLPSASQKLTVKGGGAVDPECELADICHIYKDKQGVLWNSTLNKADIQTGRNSYYKLQLLEEDKSSKYHLFRSWGRVGTVIGGIKLDSSFGSSLDAAKAQFMEHFRDKSGNEWQTKFEKQPGKMYPVDVDYGQDDEDVLKSKVTPGSKSELPQEVQDIVQMIFDINQMKQTMKEFEIDMQKMPLGKLSKKQMNEAYGVLTELLEILKKGNERKHVVAATNRFYTLIPHDFETYEMKLLDNEDIIKEKSDMLESLLEIELAYNILKSDTDSDEDPIDQHYQKLHTAFEVLDKKSDEYKRLIEYTKNTHASTHTAYQLEVEEVFKVCREGEGERYAPNASLDNRMLLWHGSRTSNYAGILSQGLRIAPPEAPVTGYMFGKGVYFADMVSKSANYCYPNRQNNECLMMLCEVALGNMMEEKQAKMVTKLPNGKHSTKGIGRTMPDPKHNFVTKDGVLIPMGSSVPSGIDDTSLLYNEYIVYDVAQINIKYLLKMRFNFK